MHRLNFIDIEHTKNPNEVKQWNVKGFPEIFIVDSNSKKSIGHPNKKEDMEKAIQHNL